MAFPKALTAYTINTGTGDPVGQVAKDLVNSKYDLTAAIVDEYSDLAKDFMEEMSTYIIEIGNIDTTIDVPDLNTDIPIDLLGLIHDIPPSPITEDDYNIDIPDELVWNYSEDPYTSDLLLKLQARLKDIIENGGGALLDIEDTIFARETERDELVNEEAKTKAADNWAKRGFALPGVGLFSTMSQIDLEYQNKRLDKSRAIAEESRKVEIQMEQHAMTTATTLENETMDYWTARNNRRLEASKAIVQYGLSIMNAQIQRLQAKVTVYTELVKAYVAQVDANKAVIEVYVAVMEAKVKYIMAQIQARIAELDAKVKVLVAKAGPILEGQKTQATVSAQIAASALAAFHASAAVSGQFSASIGQSEIISDTYSQEEKIA